MLAVVYIIQQMFLRSINLRLMQMVFVLKLIYFWWATFSPGCNSFFSTVF